MADDWEKTALKVGLECGRLRQELDTERAAHQALRDRLLSLVDEWEKDADGFDAKAVKVEGISVEKAAAWRFVAGEYRIHARELRALLQPPTAAAAGGDGMPKKEAEGG